MQQYVYVSTASDAAEGEVENILDSSVRNNILRDITGFLLYNGRNFLQLIEGSQSALQALMNALAYDPRHSGIVLLAKADIAERCCPDWRMRGISMLDDSEARKILIESEIPASLPPSVRKTVLNFVALN